MADDQEQQSTLEILLKNFRPAGFFSSAGKSTTHQSKSAVNQRQILWAVRTLASGAVEVIPLVGGIPAPASMRLAKKVERPRFAEQFWPEPDLYLRDALHQFAGKPEFTEYPQTVADTTRRYLPLVLVYLATGQRDKAETIIDFLVQHGVPLCEKQKKLLNRVAVELRRAGDVEGALGCYASIRKYYGEDEHLHFNIARTLWDKRRFAECLEHLDQCLAINPDLAVARQFRDKLAAMLAKGGKTPQKPIVVDNRFSITG